LDEHARRARWQLLGNTLLNNPSVLGRTGQWMCVEQMVKLNNHVTASNGEHRDLD